MLPIVVTAVSFGLITVIGLGLNAWELFRYLNVAKVNGPGSRTAVVAWILSFAAWWTGPLLLLLAPAAVVMGATQLRSAHKPTRLAATVAVLNGTWIVAGAFAVVLVAVNTRRN